MIGKRFSDRPADAARRAGNDGDFAGEIEQVRHSKLLFPFVLSEVEGRS
jgi:hypothetical protein